MKNTIPEGVQIGIPGVPMIPEAHPHVYPTYGGEQNNGTFFVFVLFVGIVVGLKLGQLLRRR
jgi:hypothetical protein